MFQVQMQQHVRVWSVAGRRGALVNTVAGEDFVCVWGGPLLKLTVLRLFFLSAVDPLLSASRL